MNLRRIKSSAPTVVAVILLSKIVGMCREVVLANYFGTTNISDAYLVASSVPTILFFFIGHALSTAFLPMYNKVKHEKGEQKADQYANNLLTVSLIICTAIVAILLGFPEIVIKIFAAGFDAQTVALTARLIRIGAVSLYIMTVISIWSGYLHSKKNFIVPAAISFPRNLVIIVSIVLAATVDFAFLGLGLLLAYVAEMLLLLPFVHRAGFRTKLTVDLHAPELKETLYIVTPILIGTGVSRFNKIVDKSIASTIVSGGVSALSYAAIINSAVQEILVTGIITILFASCAELVAKGEYEKVKNKLSRTINVMLFLLLPASVGVIVLAEPIVKLVLCRGEFNQNSLEMTSGALRFYTLGLTFMAVKDVMLKVFYAYKDTKRPTQITTTSFVLNFILNLILGNLCGINGLALATSISAAFNCVALFILLRKKIGDFGTAKMLTVLIKSLVGSAVMGVGAYVGFDILSEKIPGVVALFATVILCFAGYVVIAFLLRNDLLRPIKRNKDRQGA